MGGAERQYNVIRTNDLVRPAMNTTSRRRVERNIAFGICLTSLLVLEILVWKVRADLPAFWTLQVLIILIASSVMWLSRSAMSTPSAFARHGRATTSVLTGSQDDTDTAKAKEELTCLAEQIEQKERELSERLKTFHEWMEFPRPVDLNRVEHASDISNREITAQDKQLFALLENETQKVFDRILNNEYTVNGQLQVARIRDEAADLVSRIARIYQPGSMDPLLETSVAQILHATSRTSLQFLIALETLPIDLKEFSLQNIYEYVRKGVKAYGVYKKIEPYKPYFDSAVYLGRFALGASPLSLGAWFVIGTLGRKGAKVVTATFFEKQAFTFLYDLIRVIGYEAAGIYGGDFRHRDPNWLYATEIVRLINSFPISRQSLQRGLKEIGRLRLRSEYDRIFLYRCLAAHQSGKPNQYDFSVLNAAERRQIAERLEQIFHDDVRGRTQQRVDQWKTGLEQRLNVKINLDSHAAAERSNQENLAQAAGSLASFLLDIKQTDADQLGVILQNTRTIESMKPAMRADWLRAIQQHPPFYFEPPDLDPDADVIEDYLEDLTRLAFESAPYTPPTRDLMKEVANFLRQDEKKVLANFDETLIANMSHHLSHEQPKQITADAANTLASLIDPAESVRFLYGDITVKPRMHNKKHVPSLFLYANDSTCAIVSADDPLNKIWEWDETAKVSRHTRLGQGHCRISGGKWLDGTSRIIKIGLPVLSAYDTYFKPLLARFDE